MATFVRNVPTEFNAIQFKYRGTAQEIRTAATDGNELVNMDYWGLFDNELANEVKSTWLTIDSNNSDNVVLNVRVRWYDRYNDDRMDDTFELREGDWLIEDYSVRPIYRTVTNAQFNAIGAILAED